MEIIGRINILDRLEIRYLDQVYQGDESHTLLITRREAHELGHYLRQMDTSPICYLSRLDNFDDIFMCIINGGCRFHWDDIVQVRVAQ